MIGTVALIASVVVAPEASIALFGSETFLANGLYAAGVGLNIDSDLAGPRKDRVDNIFTDAFLGFVGSAAGIGRILPEGAGALVAAGATVLGVAHDVLHWFVNAASAAQLSPLASRCR